jgi:hypothetical protein
VPGKTYDTFKVDAGDKCKKGEKSISNITVATFLSGCMQEINVRRWKNLFVITVATFLSGC